MLPIYTNTKEVKPKLLTDKHSDASSKLLEEVSVLNASVTSPLPLFMVIEKLIGLKEASKTFPSSWYPIGARSSVSRTPE